MVTLDQVKQMQAAARASSNNTASQASAQGWIQSPNGNWVKGPDQMDKLSQQFDLLKKSNDYAQSQQPKTLSVPDATALGVPYGSTANDAIGITPKSAPERQIDQWVKTFQVTLNDYAKASRRVNTVSTADGVPAYVKNYANRYYQLVSQRNPDVVNMQQGGVYLASIVRALGARAALSQESIDQASQLVPSWHDTKEVAQHKLEQLTNVMNSMVIPAAKIADHQAASAASSYLDQSLGTNQSQSQDQVDTLAAGGA